MNMRFIKKFLAVTLAASLMIAPAVTAGATTDSSDSTQSESTSSSSDSGSSTSAPAVTSSSSVPGVGKSTVPGAYSLKKLPGVAIKTSSIDIGKQAKLAANEKLFARVYEIDPKGSPKAFESINKAIESVGGTYIGAVNFELGKMTGTTFSDLTEEIEVPVAFGVPKEYQGKKIGVVMVEKLGKTTIFEDQDDNPASATAPVRNRLAAYALFYY